MLVPGTEAAVGPPAAGIATARCLTLRANPQAVIRLWIRIASERKPSACPLAAPAYNSTESPFGRYSIAFARLLKPERGHRLYLVVLVGKTRIGRYILDLCPDRQRRWLVDLWAEL
jgi:hypothetical protein